MSNTAMTETKAEVQAGDKTTRAIMTIIAVKEIEMTMVEAPAETTTDEATETLMDDKTKEAATDTMITTSNPLVDAMTKMTDEKIDVKTTDARTKEATAEMIDVRTMDAKPKVVAIDETIAKMTTAATMDTTNNSVVALPDDHLGLKAVTSTMITFFRQLKLTVAPLAPTTSSPRLSPSSRTARTMMTMMSTRTT
jgi:hypothetical protein